VAACAGQIAPDLVQPVLGCPEPHQGPNVVGLGPAEPLAAATSVRSQGGIGRQASQLEQQESRGLGRTKQRVARGVVTQGLVSCPKEPARRWPAENFSAP
jgi:hypothetical protein